MTEAMHAIEAYARKHVEYYRQTLGDGLPVLTKRLAQINSEELFSDEYKKFPLSERLLLKRSCGTSGEWLKVLWDAEDYDKAQKNLLDVRKSFYGIEPDARWCGFYTSVYIRNKIHPLKNDVRSAEQNGILFNEVNLDKERLTEYCGVMEKYKPEYLVMNPDTAYLFAKSIRSGAVKIPAGIRHIELTAPALRQDWKDYIAEAFGIMPVLRYEKTETGCVALECPNKWLHIIEKNVCVETDSDHGNRICITSLLNRAMPFIRYLTEESGTISESDCGGTGRIITPDTIGKQNLVLLSGGEYTSVGSLLSIMEYTNEYMSSSIKQFRFVQEDVGKIKVMISLKPAFTGWSKAVRESFLTNVSCDKLKGIEWSFEFADELPQDASGNSYFIGLDM